MTDHPLLEAEGMSKRFGSIQALKDVSLRVSSGEVLALLGDNGAGKSTLIKILSGLYPPDQGRLAWNGDHIRLESPRHAYQIGIATVYQDLAVVDIMSIWRNMFLGREEEISRGRRPFRRLDRTRAGHEARAALARIGIAIQDPNGPIADLSGGQRQSVAIARGVHFSAKLLILDEPTSALSLRQSDEVLNSIDEARKRGLAIIVISHNVHHVYRVADRFVVLARGQAIADYAAGECDKEELSRLIVDGGDADLARGA